MGDLNWKGETVYIVGGGPSASRHDLTALDGIVVAVNDSARQLPDADVLFTASPPWVRHRPTFLRKFDGLVVVRSIYTTQSRASGYRLPEDAILLPLREGAPQGPQHNSGHEALCWVVEMGARRVVLIGFDLDPSEPTNWHDGYEWMPDKSEDPNFDYSLWADGFSKTAARLADKGVRVFNANPESQIRDFPFIELESLELERTR